MNKLSIDRQTTIIRALVEGNSIRSVERMTDTHRDTIMRLGVRVGQACHAYSRETLRGLWCPRIELDEIWTFIRKKERHVSAFDDPRENGDCWTWVAIDPETKLVPTYLVGKRTAMNAQRLINRVQLSSDPLASYVQAIHSAFKGEVDYATVVKTYETDAQGPGRYSPPKVQRVIRHRVFGDPDMRLTSTSIVERQNLTMRMQIRRFTRLTNAFSKKRENLEAAVALHFAHYNFVRRHSSVKATPAQAIGIMNRPMSIRELVVLAD